MPRTDVSRNAGLFHRLGIALTLLIGCGLARAQGLPVDRLYAVWHDADRDRDVPVLAYAPRAAEGDTPQFPLIVFSHGLGGNRAAGAFLGEFWASHGYVCVHVQHKGSDGAALRGRVSDPDQTPPVLEDRLPRLEDVSFAVDRALADEKLAALVDPERIAVAGHSYGAFTAVAEAGATWNDNGKEIKERDRRIDAAIAFSPQGVGSPVGFTEASWQSVEIPMLCMTGTKDTAIDTWDWRVRRDPFDHATASNQFLVVIQDAAHYAFGTYPIRGGEKPRDPRHHEWIKETTLHFLDAYLKGDEASQQWLITDALGDESAGEAHVEFRNVLPLSACDAATTASP